MNLPAELAAFVDGLLRKGELTLEQRVAELEAALAHALTGTPLGAPADTPPAPPALGAPEPAPTDAPGT